MSIYLVSGYPDSRRSVERETRVVEASSWNDAAMKWQIYMGREIGMGPHSDDPDSITLLSDDGVIR